MEFDGRSLNVFIRDETKIDILKITIFLDLGSYSWVFYGGTLENMSIKSHKDFLCLNF